MVTRFLLVSCVGVGVLDSTREYFAIVDPFHNGLGYWVTQQQPFIPVKGVREPSLDEM